MFDTDNAPHEIMVIARSYIEHGNSTPTRHCEVALIALVPWLRGCGSLANCREDCTALVRTCYAIE